LAAPRTRLLVWLVVPAVFAVYLITLSPTVGLIDSGELAAGCFLLNILHPTGYPLYTMLGRLASLVPVATAVNRVAVLSALMAGCGVGLLLLLGLRLGVSRTAAGSVALLVGLSIPVWAAAVDVEVYTLTLVLVGLLWLATESAERGGSLLLLAYLAGLALTNHMSGASTVLGTAVAVILIYRGQLVRRIPVLVLLFLLGVSPYLFLVLRARAGPMLAWGNPSSLERLFWHVTAEQYQGWMFSGPFPEMIRNAGRGALLLARSFVYVLVPVAIYGAVRLFRQRQNLAIGLAVSAFAAFAYAVNYSIRDIESYYLPCLAGLAVFTMKGLDRLAQKVGKWRHLAWAAGLVALALNFRVAGKQGDCVAFDHAMNTLGSARQDATIITDWWEFSSPAFYLQRIEGVRPDVCVLDEILMRNSWYFDYLSQAFPWLVERSRPEVERYLQSLDQFDHGRLKDPAELQRRYLAMLESFVTRNPERPAYTTYDVDAGPVAMMMLRAAARAPVGMLFQIRRDSTLPEFDYGSLKVRLPGHAPDARTRSVLERYRYFMMRRAQALLACGQEDRIGPLLDWYESLPVNRLAPLPPRPENRL
jgi:hypothetical protein